MLWHIWDMSDNTMLLNRVCRFDLKEKLKLTSNISIYNTTAADLYTFHSYKRITLP